MNVNLTFRRILTGFLCISLMISFAGCSIGRSEVQIMIPEDITIREEDLCYEDGIQFVDSQLLLVAKEGTSYNTVRKLVEASGGVIIGYISFSGDYHIDFPKGKSYTELLELRESWSNESFAESVSLHRAYSVQTQAVDYKNDPWKNTSSALKGFSSWSQANPSGNNWWVEAIHMLDVWQMDIWDDLPGNSVKLGVIDNAFDLSHQDLDEVLTVVNTNLGDSRHGNHVAGIMAAEMGNGIGIAGVAACAKPEVYGFSVAGFNSKTYRSSDIMTKYAIASLLEQGVKAINMSYGNAEMKYAVDMGNLDAIQDAAELSDSIEVFLKSAINIGYDFLLVKSAGNETNVPWVRCSKSEEAPYGYRRAKDTDAEEDFIRITSTTKGDFIAAIDDPAVRSRIVVVGAAEQDALSKGTGGTGYTAASFSAVGVDVYAPGVEILSLDQGSTGTRVDGGTSMAAPVVTGVAGLIWAVNPELSGQQVKQIITISSDYRALEANSFMGTDFRADDVTVVDAAFAVNYALEMTGKDNFQEVTEAALTGFIYALTDENGKKKYDKEGKLLEYVIADHPFTITAEDGTVTELITNEWGSFSVFLPAGSYTLTVNADGYFPYEKEITLKEKEARYLQIQLEDIPLVSDAYHSHAASYELNNGIHFYIPQVNLPGNMAAQVNSEIYSDLIGYIHEEPSYYRGMNYLWAEKDNMCSILVLTGEDYNTAMSQFYVYNVSKQTGQRLPNSALLEAFGMTRSEYYNRLNAILDAYYDELNTGSMSGDYLAYVQEQITRSHATENLEAAMPYVDENGDLCVVLKIYSLAGPDYHYYLYNLTGNTEPKRPEYTLHEDATCRNITGLTSIYEQFLENGCYNLYLRAGEAAQGYTILDINGDGIEELIIDMGWTDQEFHNHLVFGVDALGKINYTGSIYSYHCLSYSETYHMLGYIYPRDVVVTIYNCSTMENNRLYNSRVLYHDRHEETYKIASYDDQGNQTGSNDDAKSEYEVMMSSFKGISWTNLP